MSVCEAWQRHRKQNLHRVCQIAVQFEAVCWPKFMTFSDDVRDHSLHGIVQNCCNGRSKKYRKWHFWGCSLSEILQRIDIKFGRDDYVGKGSQYAKWHIHRFRGVISAKGWNVNGLCFFIFLIFSSFFIAARGQTVGAILTNDMSKCVFLGELHYFWG